MADTVTNGLHELVHRNGIGPLWCGGREVLRRIFVTVRDRQWREVAPTHWESDIDEARRTATITARHISDQGEDGVGHPYNVADGVTDAGKLHSGAIEEGLCAAD